VGETVSKMESAVIKGRDQAIATGLPVFVIETSFGDYYLCPVAFVPTGFPYVECQPDGQCFALRK